MPNPTQCPKKQDLGDNSGSAIAGTTVRQLSAEEQFEIDFQRSNRMHDMAVGAFLRSGVETGFALQQSVVDDRQVSEQFALALAASEEHAESVDRAASTRRSSATVGGSVRGSATVTERVRSSATVGANARASAIVSANARASATVNERAALALAAEAEHEAIGFDSSAMRSLRPDEAAALELAAAEPGMFDNDISSLFNHDIRTVWEDETAALRLAEEEEEQAQQTMIRHPNQTAHEAAALPLRNNTAELPYNQQPDPDHQTPHRTTQQAWPTGRAPTEPAAGRATEPSAAERPPSAAVRTSSTPFATDEPARAAASNGAEWELQDFSYESLLELGSMAVKKSGVAGHDIDAMASIVGEGCEDDCSICLEGFEAGKLFVPLQCGHSFHKECIQGWTKENDDCPNCRAPVCAKSMPRRLRAGHSAMGQNPLRI